MHAMTLSGRITVDLKPPRANAARDLLQALGNLDGEERFSLVLFRLPAGAELDDVDLACFPEEFLQCAGSQERMTIEQRVLERAEPKQYVLGHDAPPAGATEPDTAVRWSTFEAIVYSTEVFTGAEATEIFLRYLDTGQPDPRYHRRLLTL